MDEAYLPEKKQFIRVDVTGKTTCAMAVAPTETYRAMCDVLDAVIDDEYGTTVRDEAKQLTTALLDTHSPTLHALASKTSASKQIRRLYGQMEIDLAEARKKRTLEADTLEFNNKVRRLRFLSLAQQKLSR